MNIDMVQAFVLITKQVRHRSRLVNNQAMNPEERQETKVRQICGPRHSKQVRVEV